MNSKKTKGALFSSVIALVLCFTMLLGTTFAWFTDTVTSTNNIIKSGNLDVDVLDGTGESIQNKSKLFEQVKLWEPGVVAYENLTVVNKGSLALKYQLAINFTNENFVVEADDTTTSYGLSSALKVAVVEKITETDRDELVASIPAGDWTALKDLSEYGVLYAKDNVPAGVADAVSEKEYGIVIWWEPGDDDNNWNVQNDKTTSDGKDYLHIDLGVNLVATQYTYEEDSFDHLYDEGAKLPVYAVTGDPVYKPEAGGYELPIVDTATDLKIGSVVVPTVALVNGDPNNFHAEVTDAALNPNITITSDQEAFTRNIEVTGLVEGNTAPIKFEFNLGLGLQNVEVYHNETAMNTDTYNPYDGKLVFSSDNFSPFTFVYDVERMDISAGGTTGGTTGGNLPAEIPVANVQNAPQYENVDLPWGSYGQWSPTEGLDSQLEAAFIFECKDTKEEAQASKYADWYCDFYVKLDKDLGANQIFLGGNYGKFGWIGFHNGELTLPANTEIPLLGSVAGDWSYETVATNVGTFICGVGDVNNTLAGATFTVMLRLTNPEDANEFYNVATINYKFENTTEASVADGLGDALASNDKVELTANVTTTQVNMDGNVLNGNGNTIAVANAADATTNYGIATTGGTIQNVTITGETTAESGKGFRAVYASNATEDIVLNKVTIDATYCININDSDYAGSLYVTDSTLNGWISYGSAEKAVFTDCTFGKSTTGYANLRPYADTTLTGCEFSTGYTITRNSTEGERFTIALTDCTVNGVAVTAANFAEMLCGDAASAYALQTCTWVTVTVDGVAVEF